MPRIMLDLSEDAVAALKWLEKQRDAEQFGTWREEAAGWIEHEVLVLKRAGKIPPEVLPSWLDEPIPF